MELVKRSSRGTGLSSHVRDLITNRIESGQWRPGQRLPPEPELAASLGVSRATLREALRSLAEDGFLTRTRGSGTFVTHRPRLKNNLAVNFGPTDLIRAMGMRPGTEGFRLFQAAATAGEAEALGVPPGANVQVVERVRTADDHPVIFSRDLIPTSILGDQTAALMRIGQGSLYAFLANEFGIEVTQGVASITPMKADRWVAAQLRVKTGTLVLLIEQIDYDDTGRAVMFSYEHHLADAFEVTVVRRGPR